MAFTIGSLFDGSGGFPLAASLVGGTPVWASEVEPYPIAVTRSRFPNMKHLGDISKINGAEIEPVDVVTFGSPCQDLSVAGKRAGLKHESAGDEETTRSGLFMEAVRIIKEMREATNGRNPTYAVWENVPGAFSSNGGEDFRTVLEELIKIVEPSAVMPAVPPCGWAYADCYTGEGWNLAYRVFDAQYWGVPQRRRRIHLVLDLRGERAGKILFERKGVRGYFAQGSTPWQGIAADAQRGVGADDRAGEEWLHFGGCSADCENRSDTATDEKGWNDTGSYSVDRRGLQVLGGTECGRGGRIATNNDQYLFQPVPNLLLDDQGGQQVNVRTDGKAPTLRAETHGNVPAIVCIPINDKATRYKGGGPTRNGDGSGNGLGVGAAGDPAPTLSTGDRHAVCYGVDCRNGTEYEELTGTLQTKSNGGFSYNCNQVVRVRYIVRRLTPTECARLQGFPDRWGHPNPKDDFTDEEYAFWLDVRNTHAEINGKAVKEYTKDQMVNWYNKLHTDSAEYNMWGNGIALPPALYVMQGIADAFAEERGTI